MMFLKTYNQLGVSKKSWVDCARVQIVLLGAYPGFWKGGGGKTPIPFKSAPLLYILEPVFFKETKWNKQAEESRRPILAEDTT